MNIERIREHNMPQKSNANQFNLLNLPAWPWCFYWFDFIDRYSENGYDTNLSLWTHVGIGQTLPLLQSLKNSAWNYRKKVSVWHCVPFWDRKYLKYILITSSKYLEFSKKTRFVIPRTQIIAIAINFANIAVLTIIVLNLECRPADYAPLLGLDWRVLARDAAAQQWSVLQVCPAMNWIWASSVEWVLGTLGTSPWTVASSECTLHRLHPQANTYEIQNHSVGCHKGTHVKPETLHCLGQRCMIFPPFLDPA